MGYRFCGLRKSINKIFIIQEKENKNFNIFTQS